MADQCNKRRNKRLQSTKVVNSPESPPSPPRPPRAKPRPAYRGAQKAKNNVTTPSEGDLKAAAALTSLLHSSGGPGSHGRDLSVKKHGSSDAAIDLISEDEHPLTARKPHVVLSGSGHDEEEEEPEDELDDIGTTSEEEDGNEDDEGDGV